MKRKHLQNELKKLEQPSCWRESKISTRKSILAEKVSGYCNKSIGCLKAQHLSQKNLAERVNVSPQQINKIVKGKENLTLETISKLELALGIRIIDEKALRTKVSFDRKKPAA
jgi:ribosome-binding protein aMBF1 (putative translation factor)